jgi:sec-independent protein translocase protein TatA
MGLDNPLHIAFLVLILLLVFGARRLPEIGRSLGSGMREFKQSITGEAQPPEQARQQSAIAPGESQQRAIPATDQPQQPDTVAAAAASHASAGERSQPQG